MKLDLGDDWKSREDARLSQACVETSTTVPSSARYTRFILDLLGAQKKNKKKQKNLSHKHLKSIPSGKRLHSELERSTIL